MPNLRHLETINYSISWPSLSAACHSIFPGLVSLRITLGKHCGLFGRREVYEVLSALPGLEVLELVNVLQEGSPGCNVESIKKSILPYLSSCTIQDTSLLLCAEFHKYVFYRTATAKLRFCLLTGKEVTVSDVPTESLQSLLNTWGLSQDSPKRSCTRLLLTPRDDYHEAFRAIIWDGPGYPKKCPSLHSYPRSRHNFPDRAAVLDLIIESRGLVVRGLHWVGIEQTTQLSFGEKDWFSFFKRHSGISHMSVTSPSVREILRALSTPLDDENDDGSSSPVAPSDHVGHPKLCLPHLAVLALDPVIGCYRKTDIDSEVQEVKKFLMERRRHGLPLHRLSLGEILYKPEIIEMFSDLVVEVTQHSGLIDDLPPSGA